MLRVNNTLTTINFHSSGPVTDIWEIRYLIKCNKIYEQLDKMNIIFIQDDEIRKIINNLFLCFLFGNQGIRIPSELRNEIAKQFIIKLKQNKI